MSFCPEGEALIPMPAASQAASGMGFDRADSWATDAHE